MATTTTLLDQLEAHFSPERVQRISTRIGADPDRTRRAIDDALPLLLGAIEAEASDPDAAPGLQRALAQDHDGSLLDELDTYLRGDVTGRRADGTGILRHTLRDRQPTAERAVAQRSGLDLSSIGPLLSILAPIVMSMLGRRQRQTGGGGGGIGLDDLLGSILGGGGGGVSAGGASATRRRPQSEGLDDLLGSILGGASGGSTATSGRVDDSWKERFRSRTGR
jgi:hypothetical protein